MLHRRLHRRVVAWLAALCVLLAQTAAVAYACERHAAPRHEVAPCSAHLGDATGHAAPVPLADGNVCEVHCHPLSLPDAGAPDLPEVVAVLAWRLPEVEALALPAAPVAELEAKSAAPPPRTLYARLLI